MTCSSKVQSSCIASVLHTVFLLYTRLKVLSLRINYFVFFLFFLTNSIAYAQPANDDWEDAISIPLGQHNLDTGVFQGTAVTLDGAGDQTGEYLLQSTHTRTVWYKFTVPTNRVVRVKVKNPSATLQSGDIGFVVYDNTNSIPSAEYLADFTSLFVIGGYSEDVCLDPGTYYLQLCGRTTFPDSLISSNYEEFFPEIDVLYTYPASTSFEFDQLDNAHDFTTLSYNQTIQFNWSCLSIESVNEYSSLFGEDSLDYTKSAWFKFTTDDYIDVFSHRLYPSSGSNQYVLKIYEGDLSIEDLEITDAIFENIYTFSYYDKQELCILKANTTYSLQILGKNDNFFNSDIVLSHSGEGLTNGAYPQETGFNLLNQFGNITPLPNPGVDISRFDYFSCAALLSNDSIQCGTFNTPTVTIGTDEFDLSTWFTFSISEASNINFLCEATNPNFCNWNSFEHNIGFRLLIRDPDNECISYTIDNLFYESIFNDDGLIKVDCLPAGDYAIQILGRSDVLNSFSCYNSQISRQINLNLNVSTVNNTQYGLTSMGDVEWINNGLALVDDVTYNTDTVLFSCTKTIIPDSAICDSSMDRAIYRQLLIGDGDNDGILDSGIIVINNYNYEDLFLGQKVTSAFYAGDASELAETQSIYTWPNQIEGLESLDGCNMWNDFYYNSYSHLLNPHREYCVKPGVYTMASLGDSSENNAPSAMSYKFLKQITPLYDDPDNPENMGDIIAQGLVKNGTIDYFSCLDNPDTIAGLGPCAGFTKQKYREFYVSQDARVTVQEHDNNPDTRMRVFQGRVSEVGIEGLVLAPFHQTTGDACYYGGSYSYYQYYLTECQVIPAGWYTVVSYGYGPNYENNLTFHENNPHPNGYSNPYNINKTTNITVSVDTAINPGPFFNKPYKACISPDTIKYINTGTPDYPSNYSQYDLCMERFMALTDTPFVNLNGCEDMVRHAFYVFTTDAEYYLRVENINYYFKELYELDITTDDSLLFEQTSPISTCNTYQNKLEICRLQPGTYTLVVYGDTNQNCNNTFYPRLFVSPVEKSRFDFSKNAYDFDLVPPDGNYYSGKIGDIHPTNSNLNPSNDFFYCSTSAFEEDEPYCNNYYNIFPDTINNSYFEEEGTQYGPTKRNLWYTFVVQGIGEASVVVNNLTNPSYKIPFVVYKSDVDGDLDYSLIAGSAEQDSVIDMGLEYIGKNYYNCNSYLYNDVSFSNEDEICNGLDNKYRYYVLVQSYDNPYRYLNLQIDVEIKWELIPTNVVGTKYDHYYEANVIGNNEVAPPYTESPLNYDVHYTGAWDNFVCATGDTTDQAFSCYYDFQNQKSLWYKVILDNPGYLYIGLESNGPVNYSNFRLLEEIVEGDSIISYNGENGLLDRGTSGLDDVSPDPNFPDFDWKYYCVDPGIYYIHVQKCIASDTTDARPHVYFTEKIGDNCANAVSGSSNSFGSTLLQTPIDCHTIGDDFGEDGTNMDCLLGPDNYKSTWFKFSYTGPDLVDILFQPQLSELNNYGTASFVRYRLFYGPDCTTMIEGSECASNAYINNSIACISSNEADFYVQVVYPENSSGILGFNFTVSPNTNPDCNPFNPSFITADFVNNMNCSLDSLQFENYGTSGSSIIYEWDFGDGSFSNEMNPVYAYQNSGDYQVTLNVINPLLEDTATSIQTVSFNPGGNPIDLGNDITICEGDSTTLGYFISQATYDWSTQESTAEIQVSQSGDYDVTIDLNGCPYSDTISVSVVDLEFSLGNDQQLCQGDTIELNPNTSLNGLSYEWSNGDDSDSLLVSNQGEYWLDISMGSCQFRDSVNIDVLDLSFTLGTDTTICEGSSFELNAPVFPSAIYQWNDNSSNSFLSVDQAGLFNVSISKDGCIEHDTIEVQTFDIFVDLGLDTVICAGESVELLAQTSENVNYLWSTNSSNNSIITDQEGYYSLTVDSISCYSTDSIYVSVLDLAFNLGNDSTICFGESLNISPTVLDNVSYLWNTNETSSSITVDTSGIYTLSIDSLHCSYTSEVIIDVLDLSFDLGPDTTICYASQLLIEAPTLPDITYSWTTNSTQPSILVDSADVYGLTISDQGCSASDSIEVDLFYVNALVDSYIESCLYDTNLIFVTGADSILWTGPTTSFVQSDLLEASFYPPINSQFSWTAYENSCLDSGSLSIDIIQPYQALFPADNEICINDSAIIFDIPTLTTGNYYYNSTLLDEVDLGDFTPGNYQATYIYTDTNSCYNELDFPFVINDTSTTTFSSTIELCVDATPVNLNDYVNIQGGDFYTLLQNGDTLSSSFFNPLDTDGDSTQLENYQLVYTYVNAEGCQSIIDEIIDLHPLPEVSFVIDDQCSNSTLIIDNQSFVLGSILSEFDWDFEILGNFTDDEPLALSYDTAGTFEISLSVSSSIGCENSFIDSIVIFALPELSYVEYDDFCINIGLIDEPTVSPIGGTYSFETTEITVFNSYDYPTGENEWFYTYTDINTCVNSITIPFNSLDTTTITFEDFPLICIDNDPIDLENYANNLPATFDILYDGFNATDTNIFNPDLIQNADGNTIAVPIQYYFINDAQCTSQLVQNWEVHPMPVIDIIVPDVCEEEIFEITNASYVNGSNIESIIWNIDSYGNFSSYDVPTTTFSNYDSLGYSLSIISEIGCETYIDSVFAVHPKPLSSLNLSGNCQGEEFIFQANSILPYGSIYSYQYQLGNESVFAQNEQVFTMDNWGEQTIEVTSYSNFGCSDNIEENFYVNALPYGGMDLTDHCFEDETTIVSTANIASGTIESLQWSSENEFEIDDVISFDHLFSLDGSHTIQQILTSDSGCVNSYLDSLIVFPLPSPLYTVSNDTLCKGDEVIFTDQSFVEAPYSIDMSLWSFSNGMSSSENSVSWNTQNLGSISLSLISISNAGCSSILEEDNVLSIFQNPSSGFALSSDTLDYTDPLIIINDQSSNDVVLWSYTMGDGNHFEVADFEYKYDAVGSFLIDQYVSNEYGCYDISQQKVWVMGHKVFIPNSFTPNADGRNDIFKPSIDGSIVTQYEFKIWNRWGDVVFETNNPEIGWNGSKNNGEYYSQIEVFQYYVRIVNSHNEKEEYKGSVTLVR